MTAFVIILFTVFAEVGNAEIANNNSTVCRDSHDLYEQLRIAHRIIPNDFTERDMCYAKLQDSHERKVEYLHKQRQCLAEVDDYIARMVRKMRQTKLTVDSIESCENSSQPKPTASEVLADNWVCKEELGLSEQLPRRLGQLVTCTGLLNDLKFRKDVVNREAEQISNIHSPCRNNLNALRATTESSP